jgi:hypothetical protein
MNAEVAGTATGVPPEKPCLVILSAGELGHLRHQRG